MPARTTNGSTTASPTTESAPAMPKFELPALDFQFSSLTEGTNIPAPEPSPYSPTSNADSSTIGVKRSHDETPVSPSLSSRGSIRRLISKTLLNNSYANGEANANDHNSPSRPESRATTVGPGDKKSRRASGFFRRLRGVDREAKRASVVVPKEEAPVSPPKPQGPPPPMIPELSALQSKVDVKDGGSLGSDLFKNIK